MEESLLNYYKNNPVTGIEEITRNLNGKPVVIDSPVSEGCLVNNTAMSGAATIIVDKEAIEKILENFDSIEADKSKLTSILTVVNVVVQEYFYSKDTSSNETRAKVYKSEFVTDEDGMIIGTKLSSLHNKNVAKCSEKSVAGYIILNTLYRKGVITRKPSILLTKLGTESSSQEAHACILLDKEDDNYPTKHLLFDIEYPNKIVTSNGEESTCIGLYSLTDEQYKRLLNGYQCTPKHLMEELTSNKVVGATRIYGDNIVEREIDD